MFKSSVRKNMEPIDLDIHFPDGLSKSDIAHLAIELLKMLLLQRHQIPVQIEKVCTYFIIYIVVVTKNYCSTKLVISFI